MQYALMIYNESGYESMPAAELAAAHADYLALTEDPRAVGGPSCTRSRWRPACGWSTAGR